jgi:hypothetical protein
MIDISCRSRRGSLRRPEASLLPNGPVDRGALLAEAEPLVTIIMDLE